MFRGRERTHPELGQEILNRVAADVSDLAVVESAPNLAGMDMNMVLGPTRAILPKDSEQPEPAEQVG
jgi:translation initiation factor IF-3